MQISTTWKKSLPLWYTGSAIYSITLQSSQSINTPLRATSPSFFNASSVIISFSRKSIPSWLPDLSIILYTHKDFLLLLKRSIKHPHCFTDTFARAHRCLYYSFLPLQDVTVQSICQTEKHGGSKEQPSRIPALNSGCAYFCLISSSFWKSQLHG